MSLDNLKSVLKHMSGKHNQKLHTPKTSTGRPDWASTTSDFSGTSAAPYLEKKGWKKQADGSYHKDGITIATRKIISRLDGKEKVIVDTWADKDHPVVGSRTSHFTGNTPVKGMLGDTVREVEQQLAAKYAKFAKSTSRPDNVPSGVHEALTGAGYKPAKNVERMLELPKRTEPGHTYTVKDVLYDDDMPATTDVITGYEKGSSKIWYRKMTVHDKYPSTQTDITVNKPSQGWAATGFNITYDYDGDAIAAIRDAIAVADRK